jgi:hypothetical protein
MRHQHPTTGSCEILPGVAQWERLGCGVVCRTELSRSPKQGAEFPNPDDDAPFFFPSSARRSISSAASYFPWSRSTTARLLTLVSVSACSFPSTLPNKSSSHVSSMLRLPMVLGSVARSPGLGAAQAARAGCGLVQIAPHGVRCAYPHGPSNPAVVTDFTPQFRRIWRIKLCPCPEVHALLFAFATPAACPATIITGLRRVSHYRRKAVSR